MELGLKIKESNMENVEDQIINLIQQNYCREDIPRLLAKFLVGLCCSKESDFLFFLNYFRELNHNNDFLSTEEMTNLSYIIDGFLKHKVEGHDVELRYNLNISV